MAQNQGGALRPKATRFAAVAGIALGVVVATAPAHAEPAPLARSVSPCGGGDPAVADHDTDACGALVARVRTCLIAYEVANDDPACGTSDRARLVEVINELAQMLRPSGATIGARPCPRLSSEDYLVLAWAEGVAARESVLWNKIAPARRSFEALRSAVAAQPSSATAWTAYGVALLGIHDSWFRVAAERALDLSVASEMLRVLEVLSARPETLPSLTVTMLLVEALAHDGALPDRLAALDDHARFRLGELRELDAIGAAQLDRALSKVQQLLDSQRADDVS